MSLGVGLAWSVGYFTLRGVGQVAILAVLARMLEPADFGVAAVVILLGNLSAYAGQFGIGPSLVRTERLRSVHIRGGLLLSGLFTFCASIVYVFVCSFVLSRYFDGRGIDAAQWYTLGVAAMALGAIPEALLQRRLRFRRLAMLGVGSFFIGHGVVGILGAVAWGDHRALVAGALVTNILYLAGLAANARRRAGGNRARQARRHPVKRLRTAIRELWNYGAWFSISRYLNHAYKEVDSLLVAVVWGPHLTGLYSRAYALSTMPANYVGSGVERVYFPMLAKGWRTDEDASFGMVAEAVRLSLIMGGLGAVVVGVNADVIVTLLLGPQWIAVVPLLAILSVSIPWRVGYKFGDSFAKAVGAMRERAGREAAVLVATLIGVGVAVQFGLAAVSATIVAIAMLNFGLALDQVARHAGERRVAFWSTLIRSHRDATVWLIPSGCAAALCLAVGAPAMLRLLLVGGVAGATAVAVLTRETRRNHAHA